MTNYLHEPGTRWQLTDNRTGDDAGEYEAETAEDAIAACVVEHDVPGADTAPSADDLSAVEVASEAIEPEPDCDHPRLDDLGACTECGESCSLAAEQDGVCMDTECPLHGDGVADSEAIEPETVRCSCGAWSGHFCPWVGPLSDTVVVEFMPEHLRASHTAAGNRGAYPHNGARRIRVERSCADSMVDQDGEWCEILA